MRKNVDFLFRYEHKARELESLLLLKLELERRGYSVGFVANYDYKRKRSYYNPKVFIAPAVYNNGQLLGEFQKYGAIKKIANMQWEQVYPEKYEYGFSPFANIKEIGDKIVNFCWGENSRERIIRDGVEPEKAILVGDISLDLLQGGFTQVLSKKTDFSTKYDLDKTKKWLLFISSFTYCEMDEVQRTLGKADLGDELDILIDISLKSREKILDWFEEYLNIEKDTIVIYRPHPNESKVCNRLDNLKAKYPNFRVIGDGALKHWVNACDKIYNWMSTGVIDVIMLDKPYRMLRPVVFPKHLDYKIMSTAQQIISKEEFLVDVGDYQKKEVISLNILNRYYSISQDFSYIKICDVLEEMLNTNKYDIKYNLKERLWIIYIYIMSRIKHFVENILTILPYSFYPKFIKEKLQNREQVLAILKNGYEKNVATKKEIAELSEKLRPIIYGQKV